MAALMAAVAAGNASAQAKAESGAPPATEARVVVFNRTITTFRAQFLGTPEHRAQRTSAHIQELLGRGGPGIVKMQNVPQGNVLLIDDELALILTADDVDRVRGQTLDAATRAARIALERVIEETRESRDRARLLRAIAQAGVATFLCALAVWLTWRARIWLVRRLVGTLERGTARIAVGGMQVLHADRLLTMSRWAVRVLSSLLIVVIIYEWLSFSFAQFPYTRPWSEQLDGFLLGVAGQIGGAVLRAVPDLIVAGSSSCWRAVRSPC